MNDGLEVEVQVELPRRLWAQLDCSSAKADMLKGSHCLGRARTYKDSSKGHPCLRDLQYGVLGQAVPT